MVAGEEAVDGAVQAHRHGLHRTRARGAQELALQTTTGIEPVIAGSTE